MRDVEAEIRFAVSSDENGYISTAVAYSVLRAFVVYFLFVALTNTIGTSIATVVGK